MRLLQLTPFGPPLSLKDVEEFENEISFRLPRDYRLFLLRYNGGGGGTTTELEYKWRDETLIIMGFYALLPARDHGLRRALADFSKFVKGYLPITSDTGQQDICIPISGGKRGVYLAEYSYEGDFPISAVMHRLEDSFTEFLNNIKEVVVPHDDIQELGKTGTAKDLKAFLSAGRSIDELSMHGSSILCESIKYNNVPMVQACIDNGANLSKSIHVATGNRRPHLIKLLVEAGADVNERDEFGSRPLKNVAGTALPGEEGALNRELRDLLIKLGATQ